MLHFSWRINVLKVENFYYMYSMLTIRQKKHLLWVVFAASAMGLLEAMGVLAIFFFFSFLAGTPTPQFEQVFLLFGITVNEKDFIIVGLSVLFIIILLFILI